MPQSDLRPGTLVRVGPFRGVVDVVSSRSVVTTLLDGVGLRVTHVHDTRGLVGLHRIRVRGEWFDHVDALGLLRFPEALS